MDAELVARLRGVIPRLARELNDTSTGEGLTPTQYSVLALVRSRGSLGLAEPSTDPATRRCSLAAPGGSKLLPIVVRALDDAEVPVEDIALRRPTLDEVFLALTGHTTTEPTTPKEDAA